MRHLKVFEKFDSKTFSKILNHISDSKDKFMTDIDQICKKFDFPKSKLSNDYFQYLRFNDALNLKDSESSSYIKFWFTVDGKYIGPTIYNPPRFLGNDILHPIPLTDCKHTQRVFIENSRVNYGMGTVCIIWRPKEDNRADRIWAIWGDPRLKNKDPKIWDSYGDKAHELSLSNTVVYELISNDKEISSYIFNGKATITDNEIKIDHLSVKNYLNEADFSLVLDLNFLKNYDDKLSKKRNQRELEKKGSIAFKKNDSIKDENFLRYISKLKKFNPELEIDHMNGVLLRMCGMNNCVKFLFEGSPLSSIKDITNQLELYLDENTSEKNRKKIFLSISSSIENCYMNSAQQSIVVSSIIEYCENRSIRENRNDINYFTYLYKELNNTIKDFILRGKIESSYDLRIKYKKIYMVNQILVERLLGLSNFFRHCTVSNEKTCYDKILSLDLIYISQTIQSLIKSIKKI